MSLKIRMVKPVRVRDVDGNVIQELRIGDIREATCDLGHYWNSCPPIYKDEAVLLTDDSVDERFIELSND